MGGVGLFVGLGCPDVWVLVRVVISLARSQVRGSGSRREV